MEALPQHGVGDVEPIEVDAQRAELAPEHSESVLLLAQRRYLEVKSRGAVGFADAVLQLAQEPGFPDAPDAGEIQDTRPATETPELGGESLE